MHGLWHLVGISKLFDILILSLWQNITRSSSPVYCIYRNVISTKCSIVLRFMFYDMHTDFSREQFDILDRAHLIWPGSCYLDAEKQESWRKLFCISFTFGCTSQNILDQKKSLSPRWTSWILRLNGAEIKISEGPALHT